jgi:hypothetical protein
LFPVPRFSGTNETFESIDSLIPDEIHLDKDVSSFLPSFFLLKERHSYNRSTIKYKIFNFCRYVIQEKTNNKFYNLDKNDVLFLSSKYESQVDSIMNGSRTIRCFDPISDKEWKVNYFNDQWKVTNTIQYNKKWIPETEYTFSIREDLPIKTTNFDPLKSSFNYYCILSIEEDNNLNGIPDAFIEFKNCKIKYSKTDENENGTFESECYFSENGEKKCFGLAQKEEEDGYHSIQIGKKSNAIYLFQKANSLYRSEFGKMSKKECKNIYTISKLFLELEKWEDFKLNARELLNHEICSEIHFSILTELAYHSLYTDKNPLESINYYNRLLEYPDHLNEDSLIEIQLNLGLAYLENNQNTKSHEILERLSDKRLNRKARFIKYFYLSKNEISQANYTQSLNYAELAFRYSSQSEDYFQSSLLLALSYYYLGNSLQSEASLKNAKSYDFVSFQNLKKDPFWEKIIQKN